MRTLALAALLLAACGGRVDEVSQPVVLADACHAPEFAAGVCVDEVLNDGTGPADHRKVCRVAEDTWVLYPDGEQWHMRGGDGSNNATVLCHGAADGAVLWSMDGG